MKAAWIALVILNAVLAVAAALALFPFVVLVRGLLAEQVTTRGALEALDDHRLAALVDDAALVAALTCTRVGADPPTLEELTRARSDGLPAA